MDDARFERLVAESEEAALRLAYSYLKDWEEARDAVQEAFVKAYRKRDTFRGDASERTWFHRLLLNHLKDKLRKRRVRGFLTFLPFFGGAAGEEGELPDPPDIRPDPARLHEDAAFARDAREAIASLPPRQREVCSLHLMGQLTLSETARAMGITEGATKAHFFRAVRTLRERLAPWGEETPAKEGAR
jgi:RNA polymerase sigma-70 factor (ECF subfamily)